MRREGVAQPRRRDAPVEDREVGRVERAVADAGQHRGQQQTPPALCRRRRQRRQHEHAQRRQQHRPRTHAVDQEARQRLPDARDDEEGRHEQAELGVAQAEVADERREQRRQQHVEEVGRAVRQADQPDDGEVGSGGSGGGNGGAAHRGPSVGGADASGLR